MDFEKIKSVQENLLDRLKDEIKFGFKNENESKKLTVSKKMVPIIKMDDQDYTENQYVYSRSYNYNDHE